MAYENFALNITLIDKIIHKIIRNQFIPFLVTVPLADFCASNLSL